ncbi:MAG TPA: TIM44-like domain-containing protein [Candidatus Wallbacteria bacterium]|nr:TIM44-like domain-containing protein [Candidatus Wallbacteria bacterium]
MKNFKKIKSILLILGVLFAMVSIADNVSGRAGRSRSSASRSYSKSSSSSYSGKNYSSYGKSGSYGSSYNRTYGSGYNANKNSVYSSSRPAIYSSGYGSSPYSAPLIRRSFFGFSRENYGGSYSPRSSHGASYGSSNYSGDGSFGFEELTGLIILLIMFRLFVAFISLCFRAVKYVFFIIISPFRSVAVNQGGTLSRAGVVSSGSEIRNDDIELRIREVFFKVEKAWAERDQRMASDCMSPRLYEKHKRDTDEMIANNEINVLENLKLIEVRIIELNDGPAIGESAIGTRNCGRLSAYIRASVVDYFISASTRELIDGDRNSPEEFAEVWKFLKGPEDWIVDEIIVEE